jgi:hypothetical protein
MVVGQNADQVFFGSIDFTYRIMRRGVSALSRHHECQSRQAWSAEIFTRRIDLILPDWPVVVFALNEDKITLV